MTPVVGDLGDRRTQINHDPLPGGPVFIDRRAVRAVIRDGPRLLMVHSLVGGDNKFPGGEWKPARTRWLPSSERFARSAAGQ